VYIPYNAIQIFEKKKEIYDKRIEKRENELSTMFHKIETYNYNQSSRSLSDIEIELEKVSADVCKRARVRNVKRIQAWLKTEPFRTRLIESRAGGFWYGNVRYYETLQYCEKFNKEFKERVRAFWNYQCFECGTPQNGKALSVHHIHYDKKMCCNGSPQDVIPLCPSCHTKTNVSRDYWEQYFTGLLYAWNPNGKCFFTREEMKQYTIN